MKTLYLMAALLGLILTPVAHEFETARRGYSAIGGEFLILPLLIMVVFMIEQAGDLLKALKESGQ